MGSAPGRYVGAHTLAASGPLSRTRAGRVRCSTAQARRSTLPAAPDRPETDAYTFELWARPERADGVYRFLISRRKRSPASARAPACGCRRAASASSAGAPGRVRAVDYATGPRPRRVELRGRELRRHHDAPVRERRTGRLQGHGRAARRSPGPTVMVRERAPAGRSSPATSPTWRSTHWRSRAPTWPPTTPMERSAPCTTIAEAKAPPTPRCSPTSATRSRPRSTATGATHARPPKRAKRRAGGRRARERRAASIESPSEGATVNGTIVGKRGVARAARRSDRVRRGRAVPLCQGRRGALPVHVVHARGGQRVAHAEREAVGAGCLDAGGDAGDGQRPQRHRLSRPRCRSARRACTPN